MDGYYGDKCELCGDCYGAAICDIDTGHCDSCAIGYQPPLCQSSKNSFNIYSGCQETCLFLMVLAVVISYIFL